MACFRLPEGVPNPNNVEEEEEEADGERVRMGLGFLGDIHQALTIREGGDSSQASRPQNQKITRVGDEAEK